MLLLPRDSNIKVEQHVKDQRGRLLILQVDKDGVNYTMGNTPTQDQTQEQIELVDLLEQNISNLSPHNIILGGDFNLCADVSLDKASSHFRRQQAEDNRYLHRVEAFKELLTFI